MLGQACNWESKEPSEPITKGAYGRPYNKCIWMNCSTSVDGVTVNSVRQIRRGDMYQAVPSTPLTVKLQEVPWPLRLNAMTLPQYDEKSNPKEFLMK